MLENGALFVNLEEGMFQKVKCIDKDQVFIYNITTMDHVPLNFNRPILLFSAEI